MSPPCQSYLSADQLNGSEAFYPLHVFVCDGCFLVQLQEYVAPEAIFTEYAYFSSYAAELAGTRTRVHRPDDCPLGIDGRATRSSKSRATTGIFCSTSSHVAFPALGVEPAANVAAAAVGKGVPTRVAFFGRQTARELLAEGLQADLLIGNNVLAQVPNIGDFVSGMKIALRPGGVITMEFPHLLRLIEGNQFDTIYHEHFSYFSFLTTRTIFEAHGLVIFDVEELPTHGGSLRIYARHEEDASKPVSDAVGELLAREIASGFDRIEHYSTFRQQVEETKRSLLEFLIDVKRAGRSVVGYGAPGKGNTLLNYCGIRTDFLDYTVDRNPYKQGKFSPGTHIPVFAPDRIDETKPDYVLILPWNLKDEIIAQMAHIRRWGGQFVVPIPRVSVL